MKKGYAILLDAIVALTLALVILTSLSGLRYTGSSESELTSKKLHYVSEDALDVLNKMGVLDQVGEDWAAADGNTSSPHFINASNLSSYYLDRLLPPNVGYMLTIDDELVANNTRISEADSSTLTHSSRLLVGYGRGLPTRGNVARSFLTNIKEKSTSSYTYFGGYVGQGNLTVHVRDIPADASIQRCCLEMNTLSEFNLYINDNLAGSFDPDEGRGNMSATLREGVAPGEGNGCVGSGALANIVSGSDNKFELRFTSGAINDHYVGGGLIHVVYNTSEMDTDEVAKTMRYYFPGINGIINLYDSFFVPGTVEDVSARLHFLSNYSMYFNIGDVTVYNMPGNESEQDITISTAEMASKGLIYQPVGDPQSLSQNTVPIRVGTGNFTQTVESGNADVVLITDVSGSMRWRMGYLDSTLGTVRSCSSPSLFDDDTRRISVAKCLAKDFINMVMSHSGNRIALVSFDTRSEADGNDPYHLTEPQSNNSLISHVNSYSDSPSGGTCVCCAINRAIQILEDEGAPGKDYYIVVMTDGITGYHCGGCDYETDQMIFSTSFEDAAEESEWGLDPVRTFANPVNVNYGRASDGGSGGNPAGARSGDYYLGLWGDFLGKQAAVNRTPIDVSMHNDVKVKLWYSYEGTESADHLAFYYWDGGWMQVFQESDPDVGNDYQEPWRFVEYSIPDSVNDLQLQLFGQTSQSSEHVMVDNLRLTVPAAPGTTCGSCIESCTSTVGSYSCGGNPGDCNNDECLPAVYDAICAAKRAKDGLGAEVRTIAFGPSTLNCYNSNLTLHTAAACGEGVYCEGGSGAEAAECYLNFSRDIYNSSRQSQTVFFGGDLEPSILYPDSYLEFTYLPINESFYGEVSMTLSTGAFENTVGCEGVIEVPPDVVVSSAGVTSYSGPHWTDYLNVENDEGVNQIFRLSDWLGTYPPLGDPFTVDVPAEYVLAGQNNTVHILTGDSPANNTGCSRDNQAVYTIRLRSLVGYGGVFEENMGCDWDIEFEDGSSYVASIPASYNGSFNCSYTSSNISYNRDDALADSVYRLLDQLDLDDDGRVDLLFDPNMIDFEVSRAGGVQSLWGPANFKLIVWMR